MSLRVAVEAPDAQARPSVTIPSADYGSRLQNSQLPLEYHVCLCVVMLPAMMTMQVLEPTDRTTPCLL